MRHFASGELPRIHPASQRDHERVVSGLLDHQDLTMTQYDSHSSQALIGSFPATGPRTIESEGGGILGTAEGRNRYLAALYEVTRLNSDRDRWTRWFDGLADVDGYPNTMDGFLIALRNCVDAYAKDCEIPPFVRERLDVSPSSNN